MVAPEFSQNYVMTQEQKRVEVDAFLAEKDAMKRLKLEKIIVGQMRLQGVENIVPALSGMLIGVLLVLFGSKGDSTLSILIVVVVLACVVSIQRWLTAVRFNRQIAALKEYIDLRLADLEQAGRGPDGR